MKLRYILATTVLACVCGTTNAQELESAYFLEGYAYGHQLNPAQDYDRKGYVSFPILGNINVGMSGNLSLNNVLYKRNGELVTFLHPDVSVSEALSNFKGSNTISNDLNIEVMSVGFHALGGFNNVTVRIREDMGVNVPYEFFDLAKNLQNKDYNIPEINAMAQSFMEIGVGHSREIIDGVRVGAKVKTLWGIGRVNATLTNLDMNLSGENQWTATANAEVNAYVKGLTWGAPTTDTYNDGTEYEHIDFDNIDYDSKKLGLTGFGLGIDLGTEVDLDKMDVLKGFKVSMALNDLGFIHWNNGISAVNNGEEFEFDGFNNVKVKDSNGTKLSQQTDDLGDKLTKLYSLKDKGEVKGSSGLGATFRLGAEYKLQAYDKLSFGFLFTHRFQGDYSWSEARLAATVHPLKAFEASLNVGTGTYGGCFGWVLNFHPKGFNFFVGMDHTIGKVSKQYIPIKSNADFTLGINFPFGEKN